MMEHGRPRKVLDHPWADCFEVTGKVDLRISLALALCRPKLLIRIGDDGPKDDTFEAFRMRSCAPCSFSLAVVSNLSNETARFGANTSDAAYPLGVPLKAACRTMPSPVQPANSISAISFGFTQVTSLALRGAPLPPKGTLSVESATSFFSKPPELRLLKPVPTRPVCTK